VIKTTILRRHNVEDGKWKTLAKIPLNKEKLTKIPKEKYIYSKN